MAEDKQRRTPPKPQELDFHNDEDFEAMERAANKGLFGRLNTRFNDALQSGRGPERQRDAVQETARNADTTADDLAIRRARTVTAQKMVIPEGVIIEGHLTGGSDTEISGRIEGNITVEGRLHLGAGALVTGDVRANSCRIEGLVEGKVECSNEVDLGKTGRLNADVLAGKRITVAGQIRGNVITPGRLHLSGTSQVTGDIRTRRLTMDEGAMLNGACSMRAPAQREKPQGKAAPPKDKEEKSES